MNRSFVSYLRVSTTRQGQSGLGPAAQRVAVSAFLNQHDHLADEFVEVESGKSVHRPELLKALKAAKAQQATLLIAKLDRLARNVAFIAQLLESGVDIVAVDMPDASRFMLHIMAAVAEQEARACSERTKAALAAAKAKGVRLGWSHPMRKAEQRIASAKGVEVNIQSTSAFAESLIPALSDCFDQGYRTPSAVARYLNQRDIKARRGGIWHASSAANLMKRLNINQRSIGT